MPLPTNTRPIVIAEPPVRAPVADREALATRANSALTLAARVNEYSRENPAVATMASGVEAGLNDRAQAIITALENGASDDVFPPLIKRLDESEAAGRDLLARKNFKDHDKRAVASPVDTIRVPTDPIPL